MDLKKLDYITAPDFTISVTDDYSEYKDVEQVKRVNVNNRPFTSQLKNPQKHHQVKHFGENMVRLQR